MPLLNLLPTTWPLRPRRCLQAGDSDLMPDLALSEQRLKILDVHKIPSLLSWSQLYKHSGVPISSMLDIKGKRVIENGERVEADEISRSLDGSFYALCDLSPDLDAALEQTRHVAQKILQQIAQPCLRETRHYQTTVSIGIAMFDDTPTSRR